MKYKKSVYRSLAMVTQLGFCVLTPVSWAFLRAATWIHGMELI